MEEEKERIPTADISHCCHATLCTLLTVAAAPPPIAYTNLSYPFLANKQ